MFAMRSLHDSIPKGVQNLDLGYLWVPLPSLHPFLVSVDEALRKHVNDEEFRKHGSHVFEEVAAKFVEELEKLLPQFFLVTFPLKPMLYMNSCSQK